MMMETICTYEQATRLKRLGFDWPCWRFFARTISGMFPQHMPDANNHNKGTDVSAPTMDVAHRWLRDKMQLCITVNPQKDSSGLPGFNFTVFYLKDQSPIGWAYDVYPTYEAAFTAGLDYAIECAVIQYRKGTSKI